MRAMDLSYLEEARDNVGNLSNEDYNPPRMEPMNNPDANFSFRNAKSLPNAPQTKSHVPRVPSKSVPILPPPSQEPIVSLK